MTQSPLSSSSLARTSSLSSNTSLASTNASDSTATPIASAARLSNCDLSSVQTSGLLREVGCRAMRGAVQTFKGIKNYWIKPIDSAIAKEDWIVLDKFLAKHNGEIKDFSNDLLLGHSILHSALEKNIPLDSFKGLVEKNAGLHALNSKRQNLLHVAALKRRKDILIYLLTIKYDKFNHQEVNRLDDNGKTPLQYAIATLDLQMVKSVVNASADLIDANGQTALHWLARCKIDDADKIDNLLSFFLQEKNLDINKQDSNGDTPAHVASLSSENMWVALVKFDADLGINNKNHITPQSLRDSKGVVAW